MPSLILFNRRTHLGGDDLQPGSAIAILFRIFEFILLLPIILHVHNSIINEPYNGNLYSFLYPSFDNDNDNNNMDCDDAYYFSLSIFLYIIFFLLFICISIIFEWHILKYSSIGTPTIQVEKR